MQRLILFLFFSTSFYGQVIESAPVVGNDKNWVSSISYNLQGQTLSKGVSYFNDLGKGTQQQSWDLLTGRVWASEVRYDSFGRGVFQTLSAPINNTGNFAYRADFIRSNNSPIGLSQYDSASTLYHPPTISSDANTLGWYYSNSNTLDPYQDTTVYPYTRTVFSELNPGAVKAVLGGNKINNEWKQTYSFTMVAETPYVSDGFYAFYQNKKVMKTVSRDIDGNEAVAYVDTDGNMLGAARSGIDLEAVASNKYVYCEILDKGYVDIHISGDSGIVIQNLDHNKHTIRIFDLITELEVPSSNWSNLPKGFYRIEDTKNHYGNNNNTATPPTALKIRHSVSYYDLSYNEYDISNRLIKTIQPLDESLQTTYKYNTFGQLLETTSIDEGHAAFLYRRDGQIRFSQNQEQKKINSFSYTNYDNLGRPVESGVYTGTAACFEPNASNTTTVIKAWEIVDQLDGLPQNGRSEQNFSTYDIADSGLPLKLSNCRLPAPEYVQTFLAGNVSSTYTQNPTTNKTWYSYDIYGRVKWMIQEVQGLGCLKTIDYVYDPITGAVLQVDYQRHNAEERFVHKYEYNIAGQLTDAYTSVNGTTFIHQAHYKYNESGALIRTELADNLQGIDYVYNLNGQLKAINHPSLSAANDPGNDGGTSGFAADVFGMHLDYYNGDYSRTNTPKPIVSNTTLGTDQFNGNIKATRWNTQVPSPNQNAYTYSYNKNNWLKEATFGSATTSGNTANIIANANQDYRTYVSYDSNGNINTLHRRGYTDANGTNNMDRLKYHYDTTIKNRLLYVEDSGDNPDVNRYSDIKDQSESNALTNNNPITSSFDNYIYNDLGQLVTNLQDKIGYEYNASGLVTKINSLGSTNTNNFTTIERRKYTQMLDELLTKDTWSTSAQAKTVFAPFPCTNNTSGVDFQDLVFLQIKSSYLVANNGNSASAVGSSSTKLRSVPNTLSKISLDILVDKYLIVENGITPPDTQTGNVIAPDDGSNLGISDSTGTGSTTTNPQSSTSSFTSTGPAIVPTITINLRKADNTIIATQIINDEPYNYCGQFIAKHIDFQYTTSANEEFLFLEIIQNSSITGSNIDSNIAQRVLIDNITVEAAQKTRVAFYYDDRGQRIRKESYSELGTNTDNTYYLRDAAGSVMAIYNHTIGERRTVPVLAEHSIYGSGRIGVFKRENTTQGGYSLYQLTDHLGNVRAVIRKVGTALVSLTSKTDYYPFGMPMPNKHTTDNNYRYAFQGQEKDGETGMEAFQLRLWDGRIGRWLTVDPYHEFHSPYVGMGNNPMNLIDPDGGSTDDPVCEGCPEYKGPGIAVGAINVMDEIVVTGQGKSNFWGSLARGGADFIPFVGSGLDIYEGIRDGDGWQVAMGVGFLALDIVTLGSSSVVKGGIKNTINVAKNSDKLVDIYKGFKNGGKYFGQSVDLAKRYTKKEAKKIGPELLTQVPSRLADPVEQQLISIHGLHKLKKGMGNGLGGNGRLQMSLKRQIDNKDLMKEAMDFLDSNVPGWMGL